MEDNYSPSSDTTHFAKTMGPLAKALNILQAETEVQMGWLLPTLTLLINKLERIHINSR